MTAEMSTTEADTILVESHALVTRRAQGTEPLFVPDEQPLTNLATKWLQARKKRHGLLLSISIR
jgi:hypothetical protein